MAIPNQALAAEAEANKKLEGNPDDGTPVVAPKAPEIENENLSGKEKDADYWKQRFTVMDGKYKSELPALTQRIDMLINQNIQLSEELKQQRQPQAPAAPQKVDWKSLFSDEEIEGAEYDLGEKGMAALTKIVSALDARIGNLTKEVTTAKTTAEETKTATATNARKAYIRDLDSLVPNWREVDQMNTFYEYIQSNHVPHTDMTLQQALIAADTANDAKRAAGIINQFLEATGQTKPPETPSGRKPHVEPPRGRAIDDQGKAPTGKVYTQAEIKQFYKDSAMGKKYTDEEAAKIDKDIQAALLEGRIQR